MRSANPIRNDRRKARVVELPQSSVVDPWRCIAREACTSSEVATAADLRNRCGLVAG